MSTYTRLVRPFLFRMPPEYAQWLAERLLVAGPVWRAWTRLEDSRLNTEVAGIQLPNPIGLAAGYDKDCLMLDRLAGLGFGYLVGGTVTAEPRPGNPRPRIVRRRYEGSLVNAMGFPSGGVETVARNLARNSGVELRRLVSVSGLSIDDFAVCYRRLSPLCAGIELNISCPNIENPREFQEPAKFSELLSALRTEKAGPLFVKLPPISDDVGRDDVMRLVDVCLDHGIDGVTVANTRPVEEERLAVGKGGLSGRPLLPDTVRTVSEIRRHAGDELVINGCGGISSGEDALRVLHAGANTLQIYTGFIYGGPRSIKRIKQYLLDHMEREGITSMSALTGRASGDRRVPAMPSANVSTPAA